MMFILSFPMVLYLSRSILSVFAAIFLSVLILHLSSLMFFIRVNMLHSPSSAISANVISSLSFCRGYDLLFMSVIGLSQYFDSLFISSVSFGSAIPISQVSPNGVSICSSVLVVSVPLRYS